MKLKRDQLTNDKLNLEENNVHLDAEIKGLEKRRRDNLELKNSLRKKNNDALKKYKKLETETNDLKEEISDINNRLHAINKETFELDTIAKELEKEQ